MANYPNLTCPNLTQYTDIHALLFVISSFSFVEIGECPSYRKRLVDACRKSHKIVKISSSTFPSTMDSLNGYSRTPSFNFKQQKCPLSS